MKAIKLIFALAIIIFAGTGRAASQNMIALKDRSVINIDSVFKINASFVEYVAGESIHDMAIEKIKWIEDRGKVITFDDNFQPEYKPAGYKTRQKTPDTTDPKNQAVTANPDSLFRKQAMGISINFFPLTLLEPDQGLRAGIEIPLKPNISLHQDLAILLRTQGEILDYSINNPTNFSGFAYRGEVKFYMEPTRKYKERFYIAPQLMLKQKQWDDSYSINNSNPAGGGSDLIYSQHVKHLIFSGNLKAGITSRVSKRIISDFYWGLGIRYTEISDKKSLSGNTREWEINKSSKATPNVLLGAMFGFRL